MKVIQLEVPDQLANEVDAMVAAGWFVSEAELARRALTEFVRRHRLELVEQFQMDDIRWATTQRPSEA